VADEVRHFTATFPAGTPIATPAVVNIGFAIRRVRTIDWRVPPGAAGTTGWRLTMGGIQVVPIRSDLWVIDDGNSGTFVLDGYPDSGAWQVTGYNTGTFAHSVYFVFHLDLVKPAPKPRAPLSPLAVMGVFDLSRSGPPRGRPA
jgi:hypothetical protein